MASRIDLKALRSRCEAELDALALRGKVDVVALVDVIGARRQRPIVLCPIRGRPMPCGMWVASESRDYVFYETDTSPLHQAHIVLHELAHVLLGHRSAHVLDQEALRKLLPDLGAAALDTVLERASYASPHELEAELLASLLVGRLTPTSRVAPDSATQSARDRLEGSLEGSPRPAL